MDQNEHSTERTNDPANGSTQDTPQGEANAESSALEKRVQELEAQLKEKDQKYLYLYAEFDNFKKRAVKERADLLKFGWESLARDLLQVIDNLERALAHMPQTTDKTLSQGLEMVMKQFKGLLEKQGVQEVRSLEQNFDPNVHEAVGQEASEHPQGTVVKEASRGYMLHGRLLRPARVIVSNGTKNSA